MGSEYTTMQKVLTVLLPVLIGLIPLVVGLLKKDKVMAIVGSVASIAVELVLGRFGVRGVGAAVALVFLVVIQRRAKESK